MNPELHRLSVSLPSPTCPLPPSKLSSLRNESLGYGETGDTMKIQIESCFRISSCPSVPLPPNKLSFLRPESLGHEEQGVR